MTLIDWIDVYDKNHIEIRFRHDDEIREILEWLNIRAKGTAPAAGREVYA